LRSIFWPFPRPPFTTGGPWWLDVAHGCVRASFFFSNRMVWRRALTVCFSLRSPPPPLCTRMIPSKPGLGRSAPFPPSAFQEIFWNSTSSSVPFARTSRRPAMLDVRPVTHSFFFFCDRLGLFDTVLAWAKHPSNTTFMFLLGSLQGDFAYGCF